MNSNDQGKTMKRTFSNTPTIDDMNGTMGNSNLLKRLKSFLPQMAAANEELQQKLTSSSQNVVSSVQIDTSLANDEKSCCESDDHEDREEDVSNDDYEEHDDNDDDDDDIDDDVDGKKIIQLTMTLGNFESNPVMSLLGNADDDEEDSSPNHNDSSSSYDTNPLGSIKLPTIGNEPSKSNQETCKDLFTIRSSRRKD
jgi:hypothetical protein